MGPLSIALHCRPEGRDNVRDRMKIKFEISSNFFAEDRVSRSYRKAIKTRDFLYVYTHTFIYLLTTGNRSVSVACPADSDIFDYLRKHSRALGHNGICDENIFANSQILSIRGQRAQ